MTYLETLKLPTIKKLSSASCETLTACLVGLDRNSSGWCDRVETAYERRVPDRDDSVTFTSVLFQSTVHYSLRSLLKLWQTKSN